MKILLVDDDPVIRSGIEIFLRSEGYEVCTVSNGKEALEKCIKDNFNLIISDVMMPEMTGLELLSKINEMQLNIPFIAVTAFATVEDAVKAMKIGAEDYLTKPLNLEELRIKIDKISNTKKLFDENLELKERIKKLEFPDLIGESKPIQSLKQMIVQVASDPDVSVMIYGESGTGKELVARNIHSKSSRFSKPFIAINCAALPDELLESELFGFMKGAFTGAFRDKPGLFQSANSGTLFLDEVGEMSQRLQAKLLRVLQDKSFQMIGGNSTINVDVRIIGASNKNLGKLVKEGKFRDDLYYRINVIEILVPPLAGRKEDIPLLIDKFTNDIYKQSGRKIRFSNEAMEVLKNYSWPGNVRELENFVRMISVTSLSDLIETGAIPQNILLDSNLSLLKKSTDWLNSDYQTAMNLALEKFEVEFIRYYLKKMKGNVTKVAESIGLSRVSLYKKIKQYEINLQDYSNDQV